MSLSAKDYINLYKFQDAVFDALKGNYGNLYLTGGTALGRFFLDHRYSEDLDFFTNEDQSFKDTVSNIRLTLDKNFKTDTDRLILSESFVRIWLITENCELKIEFVNDVKYRWGKPSQLYNIILDTPANILSNKLTALVSRDEPKDVFDIIYISLHYSFNWAEVFEQSLKKAIINEQDVAMRLFTFPVELFETQNWHKNPLDLKILKEKLEIITDDFLFARDNSLGKNKLHILEARPGGEGVREKA